MISTDHIIHQGGEVVMVMFNTNMRGPDQTGEIVNPSITDEGAPLIKIKELRTRKKLVLYMTHKSRAMSDNV